MESVGGDTSCQISNLKPQVCLVWITNEHDMDRGRQEAEWEEKDPSLNSTFLLME